MPSSLSRARRLAAVTAFALLPPFVPAPALAVVPEGTVIGASSPDAIAGRYLVVLRAGGEVQADSLVGAGHLGRTYAGLSEFSARLTALQARQLAARPGVESVEQDRRVHIEATTYRRPVWNLDRIDQRVRTLSRTYTPTDDGAAVHAYVIDTGIRITHNDFGGRAASGYDFVDGDADANDCNGHGTHVAGLIGGSRFGVAKKVHLVAVRVLDCNGEGDLESVVDGVNWVTEHAIKPAVANMSLGAAPSPALDAAVARSIKSGITYAVAAGNENADASTSSPADLTAAITVGATDSRDRRASFSNYGADVDVFAPGVDILSDYGLGNSTEATMSGTSMASPQVAGAVALLLDAHPDWSPRTVRNYLVDRSTKGTVIGAGRRTSNRLLYVVPPAGPVAIRTSSLPGAALGVAYGTQLLLSGGRRGSFGILSGSLPQGLQLSSGGRISGTPTSAGSYRVRVRFTDFVPNVSVRTLQLSVALTAPVITTTMLPAGTTGVAYDTVLTGNRPGTWTLVGGPLPSGLSLSPSGELSGTPDTPGSYPLDIQFTDAWQQHVTGSWTVTVS